MPTLVEKLAKLRQDAAEATKIRAKAEANLSLAQKQLEEVDGKIRAMGIDPDKSEQELEALEEQLETAIETFSTRVAQERRACEEILEVTKGILS